MGSGGMWIQVEKTMTTATADTALIGKIRELCQTILDQPDSKSLRHSIDTFMADDKSRGEYQELVECGEHMHHKQHQGVKLTDDELKSYETLRVTVLENAVVKGFIDAQQEMQKIQESVQQYVTKTLELGRVPEESEFEAESCGHGCGCDH